jgi:hypothetical protein
MYWSVHQHMRYVQTSTETPHTLGSFFIRIRK